MEKYPFMIMKTNWLINYHSKLALRGNDREKELI